jgi:hypothetical protein
VLRPARRCLAPLLAVAALAAGASGCAAADEEPSSYPTVAALADDLAAAGIGCELEYEGLRDGEREVSTCTIDGEFALLQIWDEPELVHDLMAQEAAIAPQAFGANWIIDVETGAMAARLAEALDGESRVPEASAG